MKRPSRLRLLHFILKIQWLNLKAHFGVNPYKVAYQLEALFAKYTTYISQFPEWVKLMEQEITK